MAPWSALFLSATSRFAVSDSKGAIFVNREETSNLVASIRKNLKETHRWPLAPCKFLRPRRRPQDPPPARRLRRQSFRPWSTPTPAKLVAIPPSATGRERRRLDPSRTISRVLWRRQPNRHPSKIPPTIHCRRNVPTKRPPAPWASTQKRTRSLLPPPSSNTSPGERRGKMKPAPSPSWCKASNWSAAVLLPPSRRRPQAAVTDRVSFSDHAEPSVVFEATAVRRAPRPKTKTSREIITGTVFSLTRRLAGPP